MSARSLNAQNTPQNSHLLTYHTIYDNLQYTSIYIYVFKIISTILIPFDSFWGFDRNVVHLKLPETSSHRVCPLKPLGIPGHRVPFGYGSIPIDTMVLTHPHFWIHVSVCQIHINIVVSYCVLKVSSMIKQTLQIQD